LDVIGIGIGATVVLALGAWVIYAVLGLVVAGFTQD
jgi:hypothetical protein